MTYTILLNWAAAWRFWCNSRQDLGLLLPQSSVDSARFRVEWQSTIEVARRWMWSCYPKNAESGSDTRAPERYLLKHGYGVTSCSRYWTNEDVAGIHKIEHNHVHNCHKWWLRWRDDYARKLSMQSVHLQMNRLPIEVKNSYDICWNLVVQCSMWICWCYLFEFPKMDRHVSNMTQALTILVDHCQEETLAVRGVGIVGVSLALCCGCRMWRVHGGSNPRATIVWHVLWFYWQSSWGREPLPQLLVKFKVLLKKWVEANVHPKLWPVIGINKVGIILMDHIHGPAHEPHLEPWNCWIVAITR